MSFDLDNLLGLLFFVVFIILPIFSRSTKKSQQRRAQGAPQPPVAPGKGSASTAPRIPLPGQATASSDRGASATVTLEEIRRRVQEAQQREAGTHRAAGGGQEHASTGPMTSAASRARRGLVTGDPFEGTLVSGTKQAVLVSGEKQTVLVSGEKQTVLVSGGPPASLGREGVAPSSTGRSPGLLGREGMPGRQGPSGAARRRDPSGGLPSPLGREGTDRSARAAAAEIGMSADASRGRDAVLGSKLSPIGPLRFDRAAILHGLIWHEVLGEPPSIKRLGRKQSRLH